VDFSGSLVDLLFPAAALDHLPEDELVAVRKSAAETQLNLVVLLGFSVVALDFLMDDLPGFTTDQMLDSHTFYQFS